MMAIARRVLLAGGYPAIFPTFPGYEEMFYKTATDEQLKFIHPYVRNYSKPMMRALRSISESNTKALSNIDPARMVTISQARRRYHENLHGKFGQKSIGLVSDAFPDPGACATGRDESVRI